MEMQEFIPIDIFCRHHGVEISFISSLQEYGLIEVAKINEAECIPIDHLVEAEKLVRLHGDLEINLEGIDVITHLLDRIKGLHAEIQTLKNRLQLYELNG